MSIIRWNPRTLFDMRDDIDRMMGHFFPSEMVHAENKLSPPINVEETDDEFIVSIELPGMKKEDVQISFHEGVLSIVGEKKAEKEFKEGNFHRFERTYGTFNRSFTLPHTVVAEKIAAKFNNGILSINLPKVEEAKAKKIEVKVQ